MVIATFKIVNKEKKSCFFKKTFLSANFSMDVIFQMSILILTKIDINFLVLEIALKFHAFTKAIFIIKSVKVIQKKEFIT